MSSNHYHPIRQHLFNDAGDDTSGDSAATLTDVETLAHLDGERRVETALHLDVVTWHDHLAVGILSALWEGKAARFISSADEQLWAVVLVEASVTATLLLGQDVHGDQELLVWLLGVWGSNDHSALDILTLNTTEEETGVVTGHGRLARLLESLNVGNLGLDDVLTLADNLDLGITLQGTTLNTTGSDSATTWDGENILNSHQEWLVQVTLWSWDPFINSLHQFVNLRLTKLWLAALKRAKGRAHDDWSVITLETVGAKKLTHLHLDELQHLWVLKNVDLVDEDNDLLDTNLTGKEKMLSGLWHLSIGGSDDNNSTIHVGGTSNHVLNVIGVTWAVDVGVMTGIGSVLDMSCGDGDTTLTLFRSLVDGAIVEEGGETLLGLSLGDGSSKGSLSVVDVANGT
jgi:hypothetical protein